MWKAIKNSQDDYIFTSIVHNKEEYIKECKLLSRQTFVSTFDETNVFIDDWERWHQIFNTKEYRSYDCDNGYTNPIDYKGEFNLYNPNDNEFPLIIIYNYSTDDFYYQTLKENK